MDKRRRDLEGRSLKQKSFAFIKFQSLHCIVIASFEFVGGGVMSSNVCFILLRCDKMRSFLVKQNAFLNHPMMLLLPKCFVYCSHGFLTWDPNYRTSTTKDYPSLSFISKWKLSLLKRIKTVLHSMLKPCYIFF